MLLRFLVFFFFVARVISTRLSKRTSAKNTEAASDRQRFTLGAVTLSRGYATEVATSSANSGAITAALKTPTADIRCVFWEGRGVGV